MITSYGVPSPPRHRHTHPFPLSQTRSDFYIYIYVYISGFEIYDATYTARDKPTNTPKNARYEKKMALQHASRTLVEKDPQQTTKKYVQL